MAGVTKSDRTCLNLSKVHLSEPGKNCGNIALQHMLPYHFLKQIQYFTLNIVNNQHKWPILVNFYLFLEVQLTGAKSAKVLCSMVEIHMKYWSSRLHLRHILRQVCRHEASEKNRQKFQVQMPFPSGWCCLIIRHYWCILSDGFCHRMTVWEDQLAFRDCILPIAADLPQ